MTYYDGGGVTIHHGDCLDVLRTLPDASVDAVVTDPPYGLGFMGKEWDSPGGVGDFPMRRNHATNTVNTGASRQGGRQRSTVDFAKRQARDAQSYGAWCEMWAIECLRVLKPGGHLLAFGGTRTFHRIACAVEDAGFEVRDSIAWLHGQGFPKSLNLPGGLGTALKPAHEPIIVARKSTVGTVAANVLAYGTGALNVNGCRVCPEEMSGWHRDARDEHILAHGTRDGEASASRRYTERGGTDFAPLPGVRGGDPSGRWPANVILDETQAEVLDEQSGETVSAQRSPTGRDTRGVANTESQMVMRVQDTTERGFTDTGGASRFFYVAKADASERVRVNGTAHPTVKPLALMRWLVRLVTPPGGTVLEPFAGSGTTVEACILEGFRCIAIEREADYLPLIQQRLDRRRDPVAAVKATLDDGGLFDLLNEETA